MYHVAMILAVWFALNVTLAILLIPIERSE